MRDTVYEVLIRFRFVVGPLSQLLVQSFYLFFHLMDMLEGMFRLFAHRLSIRQFHLLGKIADRRLLRYTDRTRCRRLQSGKDFQHRRFSRTVLAHQCNTILLIYHKRNIIKKRKPAKLNCKSFNRNHIFSLLWLQRYNLSIKKASTLYRGFFYQRSCAVLISFFIKRSCRPFVISAQPSSIQRGSLQQVCSHSLNCSMSSCAFSGSDDKRSCISSTS